MVEPITTEDLASVLEHCGSKLAEVEQRVVVAGVVTVRPHMEQERRARIHANIYTAKQLLLDADMLLHAWEHPATETAVEGNDPQGT